jgi:hypothetical protein
MKITIRHFNALRPSRTSQIRHCTHQLFGGGVFSADIERLSL